MNSQYREHVRGIASSVLSGLRDIRDVQGDAFRLDVAIEVIHELMIERLRACYGAQSPASPAPAPAREESTNG